MLNSLSHSLNNTFMLSVTAVSFCMKAEIVVVAIAVAITELVAKEEVTITSKSFSKKRFMAE